MKIEKYKYLGEEKYKITIDNIDYIIYEDTIIKYNILSKKELTKKELELYLKDNSYYEAYYNALKQINIKMRTAKELNKLLKKKEYDNKTIQSVISRLESEGYLNDKNYVKAYIYDQINLKNIGPLKIKKDLSNEDIKEELIDEELKTFTKELQYEKINKLIEKQIKLNTNKSSYMLKNKIIMSLVEKGFYKQDIQDCIEKFEFDDTRIYQKEYKKAYEKLSKKYSGKELEYKIKGYMYQKGFEIK